MQRTFIRLASFLKSWQALGLGEDAYATLEDMLLLNPQVGAVIEGSGGIRKVRFALPGKGKSGSVRVIYVDIVVDETIYMLYAYPKSVKENLSKAEIANFKKIVDFLKKS
ncbi:MAG: type II toxin-antitoxin system RelE/ParE family toxin [Oscillospiraceae bacterium]|nr:type II toxin-antitoxin system RelE/ParE family toxin [Oscillospiraceae bacterium]